MPKDPAPRQVVLFSGHIVDAPGRATPRFPRSKVPAAADRIAAALDELDAGPEDLALSQAAAGGDLLFLEACQARRMRCQVHLPFAEAPFIAASVASSADGDAWRVRYQTVTAGLPAGGLRIMPDDARERDANPFERCNLWLLDTALTWDSSKLCFVCLWNGEGGDGPGGTAHMHQEVQRRGGRIVWIDTRRL